MSAWSPVTSACISSQESCDCPATRLLTACLAYTPSCVRCAPPMRGRQRAEACCAQSRDRRALVGSGACDIMSQGRLKSDLIASRASGCKPGATSVTSPSRSRHSLWCGVQHLALWHRVCGLPNACTCLARQGAGLCRQDTGVAVRAAVGGRIALPLRCRRGSARLPGRHHAHQLPW
jgi:hypothetical protein